jgi:PEP-CTERM motif
MKQFGLILGLGCLALLWPTRARAEPISASIFSSTAGVSADTSAFSFGTAIDLGTLTLSGGSSTIIHVSGLQAGANVPVTFTLVDSAMNPFTKFTVEILDPLSDGFDAADPARQPGYVPAGFSTSNNTDGLSFAWNSGLARSAMFASGGAATLRIDEDTNARDLLSFRGFSAGDQAKVTFGLRDNLGNRDFLVRLSVNGDPGASSTPEPASLLLIGTGLVGLWRFRPRQA